MKVVILFALVAACAAASEYDRYENFNIDEVIDNKRLLTAYCACFTESGKCTPEGNDFKKWIPESMATSCEKCSEHQKHMVAKMIKAIQAQLPEEWDKMKDIYDKERKYKENIDAFVKKYAVDKN